MVQTTNRSRTQTQTEEPREQMEGPVAKTIESQTAKLPSDTFLWPAVGLMGAAVLLQAFGKRNAGVFLGQWVAPMLILGLYNKIVKVAGHDQMSQGYQGQGYQYTS